MTLPLYYSTNVLFWQECAIERERPTETEICKFLVPSPVIALDKAGSVCIARNTWRGEAFG